jgi:hypothetical protein
MVKLVFGEENFIVHVSDKRLEVFVGILKELLAQRLVTVAYIHSKKF